MPRKHAVAQLPADQFEFVIHAILDNLTDREISAAFKEKFGARLSKSALNRWRESAGNELADRYRLARFQARQLKADLKVEDEDTYQVILRNIEERMLTATRAAIAADPVKMLRIRQEEEKRRLKERELELKERQHELAKEKSDREANLQSDRFKIAADVWKFILVWMSQHSSEAADALTNSSESLLEALEAHLENQSA